MSAPERGQTLLQNELEVCAARLPSKSLWHIQHGPKSVQVVLIRGANKSSSVNTSTSAQSGTDSVDLHKGCHQPAHSLPCFICPCTQKASWQSSSILPSYREVKQLLGAGVSAALDQQRGRREPFSTSSPLLCRPMVTF